MPGDDELLILRDPRQPVGRAVAPLEVDVALEDGPGLLDQELQVPVQVASPFNGLSVTARQYDPVHVQAIAPLFTVAVGLAARPAVFAANPDPNAKRGRAPKAPRAAKAAPAQTTGGGKSKPGFTMPTVFGKKGGKGDGKGNTTLPPTS